MRTLAMLLAAAALSWAHVAWAEQDTSGSQTMQSGEEMQQGAEAGQKTGEMGKATRWEGKSNFDVEGKISKVGRNSITVLREDMPKATLKVSKETRIEVNGNLASMKELKEGQDVKASFNLEDDKPLAIEIKAEGMQGVK